MGIIAKGEYTLPTITGTHTDFVGLLKTADFAATAVDGGSLSITNGGGNLIIYSDAALTTKIPIDVLKCVTGVTPDVLVRYKIPSASTGASIWITADDTQTTQPAVTDTYGRNAVHSDRFGMYPLDEAANTTAGGYIDHSGNSHATGVSMTLDNTGPYSGTAAEGDGTADYIDTGIFPSTTFRGMSSWLYFDSTTVNQVFGCYDSTSRRCYLGIDNTGKYFVGVGSGSSFTVSHALTAGNWYFFDLDYTGSAASLKVDGTEVLTFSPTWTGTSALSIKALLRDHASADVYIDGRQADLTIYKTARSADWRNAEYSNVSASGAWGTVGTWAAGGGGSVGTSVGTSVVTGIGASTVNAVGASAGVSTVTGVASSLANSIGTAAGTSTVTGVGSFIGGGAVATSAGIATVTGVGASEVNAIGVSAGVSTVTGIGTSIAASVGTSAGASTVTGVGAVTLPVGTAAGTSTVNGVGASEARTVGTIAGTSTMTGVGVADGYVAPVSPGLGGSGGGVSQRRTLSTKKLNDFINSIGELVTAKPAIKLTETLLKLEPSAESLLAVSEALSEKLPTDAITASLKLIEANLPEIEVLLEAKRFEKQVALLTAQFKEEADELEEAALMFILLG